MERKPRTKKIGKQSEKKMVCKNIHNWPKILGGTVMSYKLDASDQYSFILQNKTPLVNESLKMFLNTEDGKCCFYFSM